MGNSAYFSVAPDLIAEQNHCVWMLPVVEVKLERETRQP